jgi:hypothetical protein
MEFLSLIRNPKVWRGCESIIVGVLTGMWTVFEVLAGDLWAGAIAAKPRTFSHLEAQAPKQHSSISYAQSIVSQLSGITLEKKYKFASLLEIRKAYHDAFDKNNTDVLAAIDNVQLDTIALVRNAFIHSAGTIDDKFAEQAQKIPSLSSLASGKEFLADGRLLEGVVAPAVDVCVDLCESVDKWLVNHPAAEVK